MTITMPCPWCSSPQRVATGGYSVQCENCKHGFYTPSEPDPETMLQCSECERRCESYADIAGKRCLLCCVPQP